jgi:hypothetical protein
MTLGDGASKKQIKSGDEFVPLPLYLGSDG